MQERDLGAEFEAAIAKDAPWGAIVTFLDSITSLEEIGQLKKICSDEGHRAFIEYFERCLMRWGDPKLPEDFKKKYPLVAERLDTPLKIRIFLRGADFRQVNPMTMGDVFEDILRRHHTSGQQRVVYKTYRGSMWHDALRIVYHTQLQAWTLTRLLLPDVKYFGLDSNEGLFIDWGPKAGALDVGELW